MQLQGLNEDGVEAARNAFGRTYSGACALKAVSPSDLMSDLSDALIAYLKVVFPDATD